MPSNLLAKENVVLVQRSSAVFLHSVPTNAAPDCTG